MQTTFAHKTTMFLFFRQLVRHRPEVRAGQMHRARDLGRPSARPLAQQQLPGRGLLPLPVRLRPRRAGHHHLRARGQVDRLRADMQGHYMPISAAAPQRPGYGQRALPGGEHGAVHLQRRLRSYWRAHYQVY